MHVRLNKLVYLPLGGALGVGLLVSAFVAPQPKLAASSDCYSVCHSATSLSISRSSVTAGHEGLASFRVPVTGSDAASTKPAGLVQVRTGTKFLCSFHLTNGAGHCSTGNEALRIGSYNIRAYYRGNANYAASASNTGRLSVVKDSSTTGLTLSRSSVTYGREYDAVFHASVRGATAGLGTPVGSVAVDSGSRVLCRFNLSGGAGHCHLTYRELGPGGYNIRAHYSGDGDLSPSVSGSRHLVVHRS
jgi:hypothetical protein